ncbi:MBL fold metallo-hydrolase [Niallia circulans]|uniref:MBL fold metallo-hydrolase n=1 Tax=Niallia circulans TaxID=1397 RepID=UPI0026EF9B1D|nr:MBL fold metallo-hydrolase [Niallia circulans]
MIKIKALGTGGAFTKHYHNNYVFELGDRKLLLDAGTTLRYSLNASGYKESDITDIVITHLHSDHVGGLEEFAQRCKWIHNHKPNLLVRSDLVQGLSNILSYGLCTDGLSIQDYFNIQYVEDEFMIGRNYAVEIVKTDNLHSQGMLSMGLKINELGRNNIVFTSDIAKHEVAQFDWVIDDSTVALFHDISMIPNPVHSYIEDVVRYYEGKIDLDKIYGMHYQDDIDIEEVEQKYGINMVRMNRYYCF